MGWGGVLGVLVKNVWVFSTFFRRCEKCWFFTGRRGGEGGEGGGERIEDSRGWVPLLLHDKPGGVCFACCLCGSFVWQGSICGSIS